MDNEPYPVAVHGDDVPPRTTPSLYPEPFASLMNGRDKRALGAVFGLSNFGVNLTRLAPGAISALRHAHSLQDEFIYVLSGNPTLINDHGETLLSPGMCAGMKAGSGNACQLANHSGQEVVYLEIGDRSSSDRVDYPDDDLKALLDNDGNWCFTHKDGTPY